MTAFWWYGQKMVAAVHNMVMDSTGLEPGLGHGSPNDITPYVPANARLSQRTTPPTAVRHRHSDPDSSDIPK
ncbi:hypothetical protein BDQ94DRAFT_135707 [Aspergillus welwitschiae]|uniref:Uncharacterized protein n=1 Tax=Aspergillus welwitschiae TaxID=1341132 RepID=A0A3F3QG94_9EURO|nr:hypothetical protein BDQ94DRAFT_135707 [Aspergillus welwitschiae]RDH38125.1 hypothetical protein BDQ94DRAFT_135707 [Aspergillus welwitschiae]